MVKRVMTREEATWAGAAPATVAPLHNTAPLCRLQPSLLGWAIDEAPPPPTHSPQAEAANPRFKAFRDKLQASKAVPREGRGGVGGWGGAAIPRLRGVPAL